MLVVVALLALLLGFVAGYAVRGRKRKPRIEDRDAGLRRYQALKNGR